MAAEDTKGKKRKGAPASSPKAKKAKNSSEDGVTTKSAKASKAAATASAPVETKPTKAKSARKQAADFMDVDDAPAPAPEAITRTQGKKGKAAKDTNSGTPVLAVAESEVVVVAQPKKHGKKAKGGNNEAAPVAEAPKEKKNKAKKAKQADAAPVEEDEAPAHVAVTKSKSTKTKGDKQQQIEEAVAEVSADADEAGDDGEVDDQTAALLAGFGSDDDSDDPSEDLNFDEDIAVPKLNAKQRKAVAKAEQAAKSNEPGVIYVGRVPRGFFEKQMKQYFSQFGKVNRLRLSRNKKTGASKHFAFVEFASSEVADIVARTMDNYLLFGHILKCKLVPADQVHPDLFKGAGQRFKVDPRNKKAGLAMARGAERPQWEKRVASEKKKRSELSKLLQEEFGYEFTPPSLKTVKDVPKLASTLENQVQQQLLEEVPAEDAPVAEQITTKKVKKAAKAALKAVEDTNGTTEGVPEAVEPVAGKKSKKDKKRKSEVALEITTVTEETAPAKAAPKSKKAKNDAKVDVVAEETKIEVIAKPKKAKKVKA
ncbi:hypothetical protein T440DRAFT_557027 [Plenodomus tracheiphilus IPT5]|uniref:RRM domain-containing protein n=1 Tax=Plenodomus tracheiphilus IPT5 TaxID=1408161 RepID=A0A6A7B0Z1_9PLEO|nr:hypothetical protein T440DRAFT_557027 [Plenodomus tracheiphilus IPT5]